MFGFNINIINECFFVRIKYSETRYHSLNIKLPYQ